MIKWIRHFFFKIRNYDKLQAAVLYMVEGAAKRQRQQIKKDLLPLMNGNKEKQLKDYINKL